MKTVIKIFLSVLVSIFIVWLLLSNFNQEFHISGHTYYVSWYDNLFKNFKSNEGNSAYVRDKYRIKKMYKTLNEDIKDFIRIEEEINTYRFGLIIDCYNLNELKKVKESLLEKKEELKNYRNFSLRNQREDLRLLRSFIIVYEKQLKSIQAYRIDLNYLLNKNKILQKATFVYEDFADDQIELNDYLFYKKKRIYDSIQEIRNKNSYENYLKKSESLSANRDNKLINNSQIQNETPSYEQIYRSSQVVNYKPQNYHSTSNGTNSYKNIYGNTVHSPSYYEVKPFKATARCNDGTYSFSQSRQGTCSGHGGVSEWYY